MKASDKTSKSSLRDVFEADVVCYEKNISTSFPIIKRKRLTLMLTLYCQNGPASVLNLLCYQKNIRKALEKKFLLLVYLTESYESKWNKIDHLCLLQNFFTDRLMF